MRSEVGTFTLPMRSVSVVLGALLMAVTVFMTASGAQAQTADQVVVPVRGELSDGGTFKGRVVNPDVSYRSATDSMRISGVLKGTVTKAGGATETVRKEFTTGLTVTQGTDARAAACEILNLDIGRINLDLLGLVVNIAPISIDVTAVPGAGNLLGNLLCAVAGLLDPNSALADFLDRLLGRLFG